MARYLSSSMNEDAVWAVIDHERLGLADLLENLSAEEWLHPSLCSGWRVCDVAAHLALAHTGPVRAALELVRARGNFDRMIAETARRHATVPQRQVIAEIRAMAGSRRRAAGVSYLEPLVDVLVHGKDITVPLGYARPMPVEAAAAAASRVWTMPWPLSSAFKARARLSGLALVASDIDWAVGEGERIEGSIEALLLLLTGRTVSLGELSGAGVGRLSRAGR